MLDLRWILPHTRMAAPCLVRVLAVTALLIPAALAFARGPAAPDAIHSAQADHSPRVIEVTASRFAFEPSTIDVAVGERVRLVVKSADGVHGIEIEKFDVKKEIPRGGTPVIVEFTAGAAGRFPILCSEYCGDGHEEMTGTLVVRAAGDGQP